MERSDRYVAGVLAAIVVTLETVPTVLALMGVWSLLGWPLLIWFVGFVFGVIPLVKEMDGWIHPEREPNESDRPWLIAFLIVLSSTVLTILSWSYAFPGT